MRLVGKYIKQLEGVNKGSIWRITSDPYFIGSEEYLNVKSFGDPSIQTRVLVSAVEDFFEVLEEGNL